jgi:uncharacterized spore protein YtfJ
MIESDRERAQIEELPNLLDKVVAAAHPNVVFGQPVESSGYTVITASEVAAGGGFGFGGGSGSGPAGTAQSSEAQVGGYGAGGGGGSMGRPVAIISIGPDGVKIDPIVDVTKLGIAGISAWAALAVSLARIFRR